MTPAMFALGVQVIGNPTTATFAAHAQLAAAAARRLDDAFRGFLAERGTEHLPLAQVTVLVTGVVALRITVDAIRRDLDEAPDLAVRIIRTGAHLNAVRRLEGSLLEPARAAASYLYQASGVSVRRLMSSSRC